MNFQKQLLLLFITILVFLTVDALEVSNVTTQINQTSLPKNNQINSTFETVQFACPSKFGYYASADGSNRNMTKFWLCVNFEAHEFVCPRGTHFNVHENQCTEWISESSTREDASEVIEHFKEDEKQESKFPHHHKKHRQNGHHHKRRRHHKHHQQQQQHRDHQQLERMHRRMDEIDNRLDSLYAYVDFKLRQKEPNSTNTLL